MHRIDDLEIKNLANRTSSRFEHKVRIEAIEICHRQKLFLTFRYMIRLTLEIS
jgi:hypothetical protein